MTNQDLTLIALKAVAAAGGTISLMSLYEQIDGSLHSQLLGVLGDLRRTQPACLKRYGIEGEYYYSLTTSGRAALERAAQEGTP